MLKLAKKIKSTSRKTINFVRPPTPKCPKDR